MSPQYSRNFPASQSVFYTFIARILNTSVLFLLLPLFSAATVANAQPASSDWPSQNLNVQNSRYSELDQINAGNISALTQKWTFEPGHNDEISQVTPLVVDGVMYLHSRATMFALDATTGAELWRRPLSDGPGSGPARGSTYAEGRIYAYRGSDLYAFDASNGDALASFGERGV